MSSQRAGGSQRNWDSRVSQSQRSEGSQKSRAEDYSEEQLEIAVTNVTAFLLCELRSKRRLKKEDVVTNALNKSSRQYAVIMKRVKQNLSDVFGLEIAKIPDSDDAFIIINKHRERFFKLTQQLTTEAEIQDNMVLTVSLASIFMNRGQLYESHLMAILETIGFLSDKFYGPACEKKMKEHVTKLVKNVFVKQMYLDAHVIPRPDQKQNPPLPETTDKVTVLRWGYRTYLEVDVDRIVQYLEKIHDGKKPPAFPFTHYTEIKTRQATLQTQLQ
uniref:MAGE domain-containing protein n=1 Tax=Cuerna arida TaxID=1464854 RepID=A0A1B6GT92_9HEMI